MPLWHARLRQRYVRALPPFCRATLCDRKAVALVAKGPLGRSVRTNFWRRALTRYACMVLQLSC